jgi:hypothetical protein
MGTLPAMLGITTGLPILLKHLNFPVGSVTRFAFILVGVVVLARLFIEHNHPIEHSMEVGEMLICR